MHINKLSENDTSKFWCPGAKSYCWNIKPYMSKCLYFCLSNKCCSNVHIQFCFSPLSDLYTTTNFCKQLILRKLLNLYRKSDFVSFTCFKLCSNMPWWVSSSCYFVFFLLLFLMYAFLIIDWYWDQYESHYTLLDFITGNSWSYWYK